MITNTKINKTMKTNLTEQIEKLQSELDRLKELNSQGDYTIGEWYKSPNGLMLYNGDKNKCFGFWRGKLDIDWAIQDDDGDFKPATDSEVCEAFKNHLEANGWTKGCKFKSAASKHYYTYSGRLIFNGGDIKDFEAGCIFDADTLTLAELVKEEKIMVGENEVEFVDDRLCIINEIRFNKHEIKALLPTNPELFGKILKRMEEGK